MPSPIELGIRPDDPWASPVVGAPEFSDEVVPAESGAGNTHRVVPISIPLPARTSESASVAARPVAPPRVAPPVAAPPVASVAAGESNRPSHGPTSTLVPRRDGGPDAVAAKSTGGLSGTLRGALSLAAVVALILLVAWGYRTCTEAGGRRFARRASNRGLIEIIARQSLTPKLAVWLLRVGDRVMLVGSGGDTVRALDVVTDPDICARMLGRALAEKQGSATAVFKATLDEAAKPFHTDLTEDVAEEATVVGADGQPTHINQIKARLAGALQRLKSSKAGA